MKKILIVSTVSRQFYLFEQGNIETLHSLGYEVHGAANFNDANERLDALDIIRHPLDIQRSPFSLTNIKAYKQLKQIMKLENFDAVHCHSPMGGVLARLAAKSVGVYPMIYTAHGFHFYKGAPVKNWLIYYPIEKFLAHYTDVIITINKEDYVRAQKFKAKKVEYVPGVGVDTEKLSKAVVDKCEKREEIGIPNNAFMLLSVGELNRNKNHSIIIKALAKMKTSNIYYVIAGKGSLDEYLRTLTESLGLKDRVHLIGFRQDICELYKTADVFCFPSIREGLSVALMEAMSAGLPVVCSNIRGNTDLIEYGKGGFLVEPNDADGFVEAIKALATNMELREEMGFCNLETINKFDMENVKLKMKKIYKEVLMF